MDLLPLYGAPAPSGVLLLFLLVTILRPGDVARRIALSVSRVIQLDREGLLRAERDASGRRFYRPAVVERYLKAREAARRLKADQQAHDCTPPAA